MRLIDADALKERIGYSPTDTWTTCAIQSAIDTAPSIGSNKYVDVRCSCGSELFIEKPKGPHIGLFCASCGKWVTWISKKQSKAAESANEPKSKEWWDSLLLEGGV